jgi:hypothetical protein
MPSLPRLRQKFTEAELVELTSAIARENYRARFDHAFGMEAESFSEATVCALSVRQIRFRSAGIPPVAAWNHTRVEPPLAFENIFQRRSEAAEAERISTHHQLRRFDSLAP